MEYDFSRIEKKWQEYWKKNDLYKVPNDPSKPGYYVLDMFPYPSGAGLHVGHPLGYIASDIFARYKRSRGFNVLHPMGYDAFGLPAEQYAIDHGIHPAVSTQQNIENFRRQLDNIGFSYDWSREVRTSDPGYYKWTQWIFLQLFDSWYNRRKKKAERIALLIRLFETEGNASHPCPGQPSLRFSPSEWAGFTEEKKRQVLMDYRLSFCGYGEVNWCEALGTVLANDEVINGLSERGGFPVVKRKLRQWYLRITEYADRLLEGLQTVDFSDAMKEMQANWIGKSYGAEISFKVGGDELTVYTTRPDTIFGVDFLVLAPEHELVNKIKTPEQSAAVDEYVAYVNSRSERERMAEKRISGCFTGAYAVHPFTGSLIPVWISEYVLAGYGTGAIMAVPCGDERDLRFAKHFNIPVTNIIGDAFNGEEANPTKDAMLQQSDFLNGMKMRDAMEAVNDKIEETGIGKRKVNYKMRDAAFSRQRYWGEPFPILWKDGIAYPLPESELPVLLPHMEDIKPGPGGEGPLSNLDDWKNYRGYTREVNTMPGYAGSSWYFLRYMDPHNDQEFCSRQLSDYWNQVDLYIGGTEHAVGHLLYSRMWTKFLFDLGYIGFDEPFKKLVNQGMILGSSRFVYRVNGTKIYLSKSYYEAIIKGASGDELRTIVHEINVQLGGPVFDEAGEMTDAGAKYIQSAPAGEERAGEDIPAAQKNEERHSLANISAIHVSVEYVEGDKLNLEQLRAADPKTYSGACFILESGVYTCGSEVEKMSKRYFNVVNPDDIVHKYGADTFRMYEMFLGPVDQSKPWETKGIEGVHRFLKKLWRLFFDELKGRVWNDEKPADAEYKVLHKTIKKIAEENERFSFNTGVSAFMVCVNELNELKCHKKQILEKLLILLSPYAPHITEELWHELGHESSILDARYPEFEEKYLVETVKTYPLSVNGKVRAQLEVSLQATQQEVEALVKENETVQKWLKGKTPRKIIYVRGKMINVVV
ncbi:MAG TPA: class I tRNA ligase family protein [Flavitalea sp.]|nr:class I tRNA ligase family protein [Flavitalea sp.]